MEGPASQEGEYVELQDFSFQPVSSPVSVTFFPAMKKLFLKLINFLIVPVAVVVTAAGIYGFCRFDYYVWRLKHPDAPTWTYFVGGK